MAEPRQFVFGNKEVAEELVKKAKLNVGHWGIYLEFGIKGANVPISEDEVVPAAIVPIVKIGIQRFDEPNPLTVDASKIGRSRRAKSKKS